MIPFYEYRDDKMQAGVGGGINFPQHLHSDIELIYVQEGIIETTVAGVPYEIHKNEICVIFPNQVHSYRTITEKASQIILIDRAELCHELTAITDTKVPVNPVVTEIHEDVQLSIKRLVDAKINNEPQVITDAFFQLLWARLFMKIELTDSKIDVSKNLSAEVIAYITEHFTENITLSLLSEKFCVSRYKISRIFSLTIGVPFFHYLNAMRIDRAKGMLLNRRMDILTVAYECGFESQQTFNRAFKAECGITPREFRRQVTSQLTYKTN